MDLNCDQKMCPAREGGWGQGSHHSPAAALARPAGPELCHEGTPTVTCQLGTYLKIVKVKQDTTEAGKDHIRAWNEKLGENLYLKELGIHPTETLPCSSTGQTTRVQLQYPCSCSDKKTHQTYHQLRAGVARPRPAATNLT